MKTNNICKYCNRKISYDNTCAYCKILLADFKNDEQKLIEHYYWKNYFKHNSLNVNELTNAQVRKKYKQLRKLKVTNIRFSYNCDFCGEYCEVSKLNTSDNGIRKKFVKLCKNHSITAGKVNNGYNSLMTFKKFIDKTGNDYININTISKKTKTLMETFPNKLWNIKGKCELCGEEFEYKNILLYGHNLIPICTYHKDRFTKFGEKEYRKAYFLYNKYFKDNSKDNPIKLTKTSLLNAKYILTTGFGAAKYHFYFKFKCKDCGKIKIKRYGYESLNNEHYFDRCHYCFIAKNNLDKYGYASPQFQNPKNRKRNDELKREKYGSASAVGNYRYENELFNSSWELAFWIYHKDKGHPIKREPTSFDYYVDNKIHQYWPDFKVYNTYFEIKGDRFLVLDDDDNVIDFQTFDRERTKEASEKYKCLREHNVKLITYKQIQKYLNYVKSTYGDDYLNKFKIKQ